MFAYHPFGSFIPHSRIFYQPTRPYSNYHNLYDYPDYPDYPYYPYYPDYNKRQEEREQERERLKRFYDRKSREQQAQQSGTSTFTKNRNPKRSFRVKVQGSDDDKKSTINKSQAANKIFNFIKKQTANKKTRKILNKLHILHIIENDLKEIKNVKIIGNLTFNKEHEKQILLISTENKKFLEYEDKIIKLFDKLDGVQSEGFDIIRERRKFLVKSAQILLEELDNEKEKQWEAFNKNLDVVDVHEKEDESDSLKIVVPVTAPSSVASLTEEVDNIISSEVDNAKVDNITSSEVDSTKVDNITSSEVDIISSENEENENEVIIDAELNSIPESNMELDNQNYSVEQIPQES